MRNSVVLLDFDLSSKVNLEKAFEKLLSFPFSGNQDYGFIDLSFEDIIIDGIFISKNNTYVNRYDDESKRIFKEKVVYIAESGFRIDFSSSFLEYFGAKMNFGYFKRALKEVWQDFSLDSIHLNLRSKVYELAEKHEQLQIEFINLPRFKYNEFLIGKYQVKVYDHREGLLLIDKYDDDISSVKFTLTEFEEILIELTSDFRITAHCHRPNFLSIIESLK